MESIRRLPENCLVLFTIFVGQIARPTTTTTKTRQWSHFSSTGGQFRLRIEGCEDGTVDGSGALEQLVDNMGSDAPGKEVVRDLGNATGFAQDFLRSEAEERTEKLEMLDSQSCPSAKDVAYDPMPEAEHALGFALGDPGVGEALPQDFDDGGFKIAVANVQCVHLLGPVSAAWRPGCGQMPGELLELVDGFAEVVAENAFQNSAGLLVRELFGAQREGDIYLPEGIEGPPEVFHRFELRFPSGRRQRWWRGRHSRSPWLTSMYAQGIDLRSGWGGPLFRMAEHVRRWRRILPEGASTVGGQSTAAVLMPCHVEKDGSSM